MIYKLFNSIKGRLTMSFLMLMTPSIKADWFALNMTRGVTDVSNEVFELHMLIFWICVAIGVVVFSVMFYSCLLYTSPSPRDRTRSRMPSSA